MSDAQTFPMERPSKPAMLRGLRCKCPSCGEGHIFSSYLKVVDRCPACNEDLSQHRADDGPAYLTILIVAHIIGFAIHIMWVVWEPRPVIMATTLGIGAVALSLFLLPRLKGMIVAIQWARRMHGFGRGS